MVQDASFDIVCHQFWINFSHFRSFSSKTLRPRLAHRMWNFVEWTFFALACCHKLLIFYVHLPLNPASRGLRDCKGRGDRHWNLCAIELLLLSKWRMANGKLRMANGAFSNKLREHAESCILTRTNKNTSETIFQLLSMRTIRVTAPWKNPAFSQPQPRFSSAGTWATWAQVVSCECIFGCSAKAAQNVAQKERRQNMLKFDEKRSRDSNTIAAKFSEFYLC